MSTITYTDAEEKEWWFVEGDSGGMWMPMGFPQSEAFDSPHEAYKRLLEYERYKEDGQLFHRGYRVVRQFVVRQIAVYEGESEF